jgi:hypothetical protein
VFNSNSQVRAVMDITSQLQTRKEDDRRRELSLRQQWRDDVKGHEERYQLLMSQLTIATQSIKHGEQLRVALQAELERWRGVNCDRLTTSQLVNTPLFDTYHCCSYVHVLYLLIK